MPDIKWIKITTDMFDDEKIKLIEAMPDADTLLVIWVKLICQAGKVNSNGYIFLSPELPFSAEHLATIFGRPVNTIRLALTTFAELQMIEIDEQGFISLPAWERHQNIEGMEKIKEQAKVRQQKHRLSLKDGSNVTSRDGHAPDKSRIEKSNVREDKEKNREDKTDALLNIFYEIKNKENLLEKGHFNKLTKPVLEKEIIDLHQQANNL